MYLCPSCTGVDPSVFLRETVRLDDGTYTKTPTVGGLLGLFIDL